ncbi:hypothetical protein ECP03018673_5171 [Escherichia coli P0301867.3]|nr:hypothetical protein EC2720900_5127 [Escherichia coli 2720900]ENG92185.1 hypothetical protein ECP03018673_5171 [Escherichia coli P0301867.3]
MLFLCNPKSWRAKRIVGAGLYKLYVICFYDTERGVAKYSRK